MHNYAKYFWMVAILSHVTEHCVMRLYVEKWETNVSNCQEFTFTYYFV